MAGPPLSAPSRGQSRRQTMARALRSALPALPPPYLALARPGMLPRFPPLESQALSSPRARSCHTPAPVPNPIPPHWSSVTMATASLSGRDQNLPIFFLLLLPRSPCTPPSGASGSACGEGRAPDVGGGGRGPRSAPRPPARQAPGHSCPHAGFRVSWGQFSSHSLRVSLLPLCTRRVVTPGCQPA